TIDPNMITFASSNGIRVSTYAENFGVVSQTLTITDNFVSAASRNGIYLYTHALNGDAFLTQALDITGNTLVGNGRNGLYLRHRASSGTVSQTGSIVGNIISDNVSHGIRLVVSEGAGTGLADTALYFNSNNISFNSSDGVFVSASSGGATATISLGPADVITFNSSIGVELIKENGAVINFTQDGATITDNPGGNVVGP